MRSLSYIGSFLTLSSTAWAHPGHGQTTSDSITHWFIEPAHNWWIVVAIVGASMYLKLKNTHHGETSVDPVKVAASKKR